MGNNFVELIIKTYQPLYSCYGIVKPGTNTGQPRISPSNCLAELMHYLLWGEFIPWWILYPPVVMYGIYLSIKYKSVTLPTIANPGIFTGGAFGESKNELSHALYQASPAFTAKSGLVEGSSLKQRLQSFREALSTLGLNFPIVLKPDIGQGGLAVKVVSNLDQAEEYLSRFNTGIIVQEYIAGPYEAGIYYYRFPDQEHGAILDITDKQFPVVRGDGKHDIEYLILRGTRTRLFASQYLEQLGSRAQLVLPQDEEYCICNRGNWVQGCVFLDGKGLWSAALEKRIDEISQNMGGFFVGRYDIRYQSREDLILGRGFKIVELNGITAIPTSIKDPNTDVWRAWRLLCHVLWLLYEIGHRNQARGREPMSITSLLKAFLDARGTMDAISAMSHAPK